MRGLGGRLGAALLLSSLLAAPARAAELLGVQAQSTADSLVLQIESDQLVEASDVSDEAACRIRLKGLSPARLPLTPQALGDERLAQYYWVGQGPDAELVVPWGYRLPVALSSALGPSKRWWLRLDKLFVEEATEDLAPGISLRTQRRGTAVGPMLVWALEVDPSAPGVRVAPVVAQGRWGFGLEPVSRLAGRAGAIAAINGAYFGRGGQPLGLLMIGGELLSGPIYGRTALAWGPTGPSIIDRAAISAVLEMPDGQSVDVDGFNQPRQDDQIVVYTDRYGATTRTEPKAGALEIMIDEAGRVVGSGTGNGMIPAGGYVISATGAAADWLGSNLSMGSLVKLRVPLSEYLDGASHVLGAGPRLLEGGQVKVNAEAERFQPDVAQGRAPRTAVGVTPGGKWLLVTVDGRDSGRSVGLTLTELAGLMKELGAVDALNLDGGGSTTIYARGAVLNRPSDGSERPVSNALAVWSTATQAGR